MWNDKFSGHLGVLVRMNVCVRSQKARDSDEDENMDRENNKQ